MKNIFTFLFGLLLAPLLLAQSIGIASFATGFSAPVEITHPQGDERLFVVQQGGAIRILNPNGTINPTNFLTLTTATISTGGERGLLGLAFHPNYAVNGYFYVNYTNTAGNTVIARYTVSTNPNVADATSAVQILTVNQPFSNHNGGTLKFGPDGYLYIGMGDGGSAGDPGNRAQNINENLGKMLRIDVDSASPYGIPADNPFVGAVPGNDEIWAIGMRNPWKFSFDMANGDLWIGDVGQNQYEEINHIPSPAATGLNFGWKCYEGTHVYSTCTGTTTFTYPLAEYSHGASNCSITGGYVYRGSTYPNLVGKYVFADLCSNKIGYVQPGSGTITWTATLPAGYLTTFGQDINGEVYVGSSSNGTIYKLIDTSLAANSFDRETFDIYPNPAQDELFLKTNGLQFPAVLTVSDTSGKTLLQQSINADTNSISIASLATGMYIVSVNDQAGLNISSKLSVK